MDSVFKGLLIVGILLVLICLIIFFIERKRFFTYLRLADEKKEQLKEILTDAKTMMEELNNLSTCIIDVIEEKKADFKNNVRYIETEIRQIKTEIDRLGSKAEEVNSKTEEIFKALYDMNFTRSQSAFANRAAYTGLNTAAGISMADISSTNDSINFANKANQDRKNILNNKYSEVVRLYRSGMDETEIARKLNMGVGEIQLVLQFNNEVPEKTI